ncbi:ArsA family ATPase [Rubrobacter calidifluminis]|uniref:ArsA family ATPase n=1 Tax=Rubrobacter calidifluminis TaxID=1392640 RepID=UPI0023617EB5|nr:TRC40/GET3/ArsA family transport-energizing ATPase [Rubrobacter calidifluminis]
MRIILYTGKGGVGKTSVAAATALKAASGGKKVLVMSTDPAHSLSDSFDEEVGAEPREIVRGVWAQEMDHTTMVDRHWGEIQGYLKALFEWQGTDSLTAEDLAMLPGADEIFGLLLVREHCKGGIYDALILDAAPTGETLRLLSLPDQLSWYVEKIFPIQRRAARLARPFVRRAKSLPPMPDEEFFAAAQRFYDMLSEVKDMLADRESASVRLVVNPEKMVVAEARRSYTYLNLYDYGVDAVVVNRVLPEDVSDPYFDRWREAQKRHLAAIEESFSPLPIFRSKLFGREMFGVEALLELGDEIFGERDPLEVFSRGRVHRITRGQEGYEVSVPLPLARREDLELSKRGTELVVKVRGYRRNILLPDFMGRFEAGGASFEDGMLKVRLHDETR